MENRFRSIYVSLQTSIAFLFSVIVIILGMVIFLLSYFTFDDLINDVSNRALMDSTKTVNLKLSNLLSPYTNFSKITNNVRTTQLLDLEDKENLRKYFLGILAANPSMYSIYVAKPNGTFFQIKKKIADPGLYIEEDFNRDQKPEVRTQSIYDEKGSLIDQQVIDEMQYDPRLRDWYIAAKGHEDPVWSSIYQFAIKQERDLHGITHSRSIFDGANLKYVIGIDVETNDLLDFIRKQKIFETSEVYLIDKDGKILSSSKAHNEDGSEGSQDLIDDPKLLVTYLNYMKSKTPVQLSKFEGEEYLAAYRPVDDLEGAEWVVGHIVNYKEVTAPIRRMIFWYWVIMLSSTLISIVIAVYVSGRISRPINELAFRAKKLAQLELDHEDVPESRIKEIRRLSKAFESMDAALVSFNKYMPTNLVKRLLKQKVVAEPGGTTRVLPVMFLDFKNFTTVSESMDPDFLMEYLSGYLECMTKVIHQHDGTIDKYIGDSIMAFWGAPGGNRDVHTYTVKACECTLAMQKELEIYNQKMLQKKMPILEMRIGLHVGEMTVGNLGSSDKLNYTVIGDNVNLASRLESLCKYYHVGNIVSEDVYKMAGEHLNFRLLDSVKVKGKSIAIKVYELSAEKKYQEQDQTLFEEAFRLYQQGQWERSLKTFRAFAERNPDDYLTDLFISRMEENGGNPPSDWDGSWTMESK